MKKVSVSLREPEKLEPRRMLADEMALQEEGLCPVGMSKCL